MLAGKGIDTSNVCTLVMRGNDDDNVELLLNNIDLLLSKGFAGHEEINKLLKHQDCCAILAFVVKNFSKLTSHPIEMNAEQLCLITVKTNRRTLEVQERRKPLLTIQNMFNKFNELLRFGLTRDQIFSIAMYDNGYKNVDAAIKFMPEFVSCDNTTDEARACEKRFSIAQMYTILASTDSRGGESNLNAVREYARALFRLGFSSSDIVKLCSRSGASVRFKAIISNHEQLTSKATGMQHVPGLNKSQILDMVLSSLVGYQNQHPAVEKRIKAFLDNRNALIVTYGYSLDQILKITIADQEILPELVDKHAKLTAYGFTHEEIVLLVFRKKGQKNLGVISARYEEFTIKYGISHKTIVEMIRDKNVDDIELALIDKLPSFCDKDAGSIVDNKLQIENALLDKFGFNIDTDITTLRKDDPKIGLAVIALELAKRLELDAPSSRIAADVGVTDEQLKPFLDELKSIETELECSVYKLQNILRSLDLSTSEQVRILKNRLGLRNLKMLILYTPMLLSNESQQKFSKENLIEIAGTANGGCNIIALAKNLASLLKTDDQSTGNQVRFTYTQLAQITGKQGGNLAIQWILTKDAKELFATLHTAENITKIMQCESWHKIVVDILKHKEKLSELGINAQEIIGIAAYDHYIGNISLLVENFAKLDGLLESIHPSADIRKQKILAMLRLGSAHTRLQAYLKARETNPKQDAIISTQGCHLANGKITSRSDATQVAPNRPAIRRDRNNAAATDNAGDAAVTKKIQPTKIRSNSAVSQLPANQQRETVVMPDTSGSVVPHNNAAVSTALPNHNFAELASAVGMGEDAYIRHYQCLVNDYQQSHLEAVEWLSMRNYYDNLQRLEENVDKLTSSPINLTKAQALTITFLPYQHYILDDLHINLADLRKLEKLGIDTGAITMALLAERDRQNMSTVLEQIDTLLHRFQFSSEAINQLLTAKTLKTKIPILTITDIYQNLLVANSVFANFTCDQIVKIVVRSKEKARKNLQKLNECYAELSTLGFDNHHITAIAAFENGDANIREVTRYSRTLIGCQASDDHHAEPGLGFTHSDICAIIYAYGSNDGHLNLRYVQTHVKRLLELGFTKDDIVRMSNFTVSRVLIEAVCLKIEELKTFVTNEQIVTFIRKNRNKSKDIIDDLLALKSKLEDAGFNENQFKILAHHEDIYTCFNAIVNLLPELKKLGLSNDDIMIIASHINPEENLNYVVNNYHDICKRHRITRFNFMKVIERNPDKDVEDIIDSSYECPAAKKILLEHNFTEDDLLLFDKYDIRTCKIIARYLDQLLYRGKLPNGSHGLKLDISQLQKLAGCIRGSYNILALMQYQHDLLESDKFSIDMLLKLTGHQHGSKNLQKTFEIHKELLDSGFNSDQITKIVSRPKEDEFIDYFHANLSCLMTMFSSTDQITAFMCKLTFMGIQTIVNHRHVLTRYFSSTQLLQLATGKNASENVQMLVNNIEKLETLLGNMPVVARRCFMVELACGINGVSKIKDFLKRKEDNPNYNPSFFMHGRQRKNTSLVDSAAPTSVVIG